MSNTKISALTSATTPLASTVTGKFYSFGVGTISSGTVTSITNLVL